MLNLSFIYQISSHRSITAECGATKAPRTISQAALERQVRTLLQLLITLEFRGQCRVRSESRPRIAKLATERLLSSASFILPPRGGYKTLIISYLTANKNLKKLTSSKYTTKMWVTIWPRQPVYKKQAGGQVFHLRALLVDRFFWKGFFRAAFQTGRQKRVKREETISRTGF